jgi:alkylation response protein AidB-like acyl-CoA dehydrogenase
VLTLLDSWQSQCHHAAGIFSRSLYLSYVYEFMGRRQGLLCEPLLPMLAEQAAKADRTRSVDPAVIQAIKRTDIMRMSATRNIGGIESSITAIAHELEAIAGCCASTAWCLWNHLCVFHFICAQLGPMESDLLKRIVTAHEWVTFPAGAGTSVRGRREGENVVLNGRASFATGSRYGEWAACLFALEPNTPPPPETKPDLRFTIVRTNAPGVSIDPSWFAMSLRASATDHINYRDVIVPFSLLRPFTFDFRYQFRDPKTPVVAHRYREDWVALSVLWLAAQTVGVASAALHDACEELRDRVAIYGVKVAERPAVQLHIGQAGAALAAARAAMEAGCADTDDRIAAGVTPTEADYLRQLGYGMAAVRLCDEVMRHLLQVQGGNGLREDGSFERRYRDMQAMQLHINAHPDRVSELVGKYLLGLVTDAPFQ